MTQEVKVLLQLTLDVDAKLSKEEIRDSLYIKIPERLDLTHLLDGMRLMMTDIIEIQEESEIYGTEN